MAIADLTDVKHHSGETNILIEWAKCQRSAAYFIDSYAWIYDSKDKEWIRFRLWLAQFRVLMALVAAQFMIILKARQLGLTWLMLGYALHQMLFEPIAHVLLFSLRDDEAVELLKRLKGMYERLPAWMKAERVVTDNDHTFELSNGSTAKAFPTTAGDSYTATFALIDEADLVPDLDDLLARVKPTIDAAGKLVLLSRSNKKKTDSAFKKIYRAAKQGLNEWRAAFLPWWVHPDRNKKWYAARCADAEANQGTLDSVYEQYPATDTEALAPNTLDKRIPPKWLEGVYQPARPIPPSNPSPKSGRGTVFNVAGLAVFEMPKEGARYVCGVDCAEGLPTSDDSVSIWLDAETGEQVAVLAGKITPAMHAAYTAQICEWYNGAAIMAENNNHGWALLLWLADNTRATILNGHNGKVGWSSNTLGKVLLYNGVAENVQMKTVTIRDFETMSQLQSIEKSTLRAPQGFHDDYADAFALAVAAMGSARIEKVYDESVGFRAGY